jgi:uncharacterized protein YeaO (DUF488 family)
MDIRIQRAYDDPAPGDGYRVLVDRVWPRGRSRQQLALDAWARDLAPSTALRQWFGHRPERWDAFRSRYLAELAATSARAQLRALRTAAGRGPLTLVYGARDALRNQAVVLREALRALARR